MFGLGVGELLIVLVIVLLLFNKRLPDLGASIGESLRQYRKAVNRPDAIDVTPKQKSDDPS